MKIFTTEQMRAFDRAASDKYNVPSGVLMENAALNAIRAYLEPGESAVGTAIDIEHIAATPVGHEVTAQAEVTRVDGRQIEFKVSARDQTEEIGRGTHRRMAIDLGRFNQRLAVKAKRQSP